MSPNDEYWNHQQPIAQPQMQQGPTQQPLPQDELSGQVGASSRVRMSNQAQSGLSAQPIEEDREQSGAAKPQPQVVQSVQAQRPVEFRPQYTNQFEMGGSAQLFEPNQAQQQSQVAHLMQASQFEPEQQQAQAQPAAQFVGDWNAPAQAQSQPAAQFAGEWHAPAAPQAQAAGYATQTSQQATAAAQKKSRGWIVAIVITLSVLAFLCFSVYSCTNTLSGLSTINTSGDYGLDGVDGDVVAVIDLDGTIQYDGTACSPEGLKELLDRAQENNHVKALVLRVNSGGGTATAGEEMAEYLRQFDKPVVVSSASINASAAYEISSQADYIYVAKSTEIGAIGTVMQVTDLSGLFEKLGIKMETIASAESKDSSYGYRSLTEEERAYYQDMITQINDMFIENVATGRKMKEADVRKLATGLVFTGATAVENGLADGIGTREDAVKKAAELAGITEYTTANLTLTSYDLGNLAYLLGEDRSSASDLLKLLEQADEAKLRQ